MASRRLKSGRFPSQAYRKEIYTNWGLDWVERSTTIDVISRHVPKVAGAMKGVDNALSRLSSRGAA